MACALALLAAPAVPTGAQQPALDVPRLPVVRDTLANGLTVILSEDHASPVVAVDLWYHVGSKNEKPGRTGFAHLFEHVMFQGSEHVGPEQHAKMIEAAGGDFNGQTSNDHTLYYDIVPSNELARVLWLESDRMGWLLPAMDQRKLDAQRDVVKNERRQSVDNRPFGTEGEVLAHAIYPDGNPYSWPVIGSMADLSAATLQDVKDFFRAWYAPNNATLVIVGDIDPAKTDSLVEKFFGGIPRGPAVSHAHVAPVTLPAEKRLVLEDARARLPQMVIAWPTVGEDSADAAPLAVLASLLTQDRTSRLTKRLVYDRQIATGVMAYQGSNEDVGEFYVSATPRPDASLTDIELAIDSVLADVAATPPSAEELQRVKNYLSVGLVTGLQASLQRADLLAEGQTFFDDPLHYVQDAEALWNVTPADVQRVAARYLGRGRVVLSMVPAGKLELISRPELPYVNVSPAPAGGAPTR